MRHSIISACVMLLASACGPQPVAEDGNRAIAGNAPDVPPLEANDASPPAEQLPAPAQDNGNAVTVPPIGTPGTSGGLPDDRTPLEEPRGPIDPRSAEGAGQVVQRYGALLEERRFADARKLWGNGGGASGLSEAQFVAAYGKYAAIHSEVGKPEGMEGAAGSSYITVPFRLYGTLKGGGPFNLVGPLTLRRVNDVPGSTAEQRRWHIEKSGLKPRP